MADHPVIHISTGTVVRVILLGLLFWALFTLHNLVLVLLTSVVIASSIEPATKWFARFKIPRLPAVLVVYATLVLVVIGVLYLFVPLLTSELGKLSGAVPGYAETARSAIPVPFSIENTVGQLTGDFTEKLPVKEGIQTIQQTLARFSEDVLGSLSKVFGGVLSFLLIFIISFYLSVQERGIEEFLRIVAPVRHEKYIIDLWKRSQDKIGKWMQGQLMLGFLIGVLVYLGLTILGVPYAFSLAVLSVIAELIPVFGPIIAAIPAVLLGFLESSTLGVLVLGFYIIVQQFENNLIYPLIVQKVVGVPPLVVIIALIVGGQLAGFLGILLSVPLAAVLLEYLSDIAEDKRRIAASVK